MMQQHWQSLAEKFSLLSMRERFLIVFALIFILVYSLYSLVLAPNYKAVSQAQAQLTTLTQQQQQLSFDKTELQRVLAHDPNAEIKLRITRAQTELSNAENKLTLFTADLIDSKQMALVLGDVLQQAKKVKLLAIESLPATALNTQSKTDKDIDKQATTSAPNAEIQLYQHGLRITLTGTFFDIQAYLNTIEQLPKKFYWRIFDYQMQRYPQAEVVMEIYTLSMNKEFIRG
jgi:MSHA biogenesis protein MshJ